MTRYWWRIGALLFAAIPMFSASASDAYALDVVQKPAGRMVAQIILDGPIGPAAAEYFENASMRAERDGAQAIVLKMDTPGGLSESMRLIISRMLASQIPVLVYVAPGGARAASAGTYILYAGQIAAMAPATHVGAATPVALVGSTPLPSANPVGKPAVAGSSAGNNPEAVGDDAESNKVANDAIAYIRSLAQLRSRNADWAERAVRGAATLTASEAAQQNVIDFVASDVNDLLVRSSGRKVTLGDRTVTLDLKSATVRTYAPGSRTRFLAIITNPTIAYLLLLGGIFGLGLEALHPGAVLPGIVGAISLLVGLYALQWLPVNYAGLALMALGIGLLVAEAVNPGVGALGIGGLIAFVTGSIMLMNTGVPGYAVNLGVIGGIAVCAAGLLALVVWLVLRSRRARLFSGDAMMLTASGDLLQAVGADGESWMMLHGERWRVHCDTALPACARVRVLSREGLLLRVEAAQADAKIS